MKGNYPYQYFHNPDIKKSIYEIWDDIDSYSGEYFEDEQSAYTKTDFFAALPPLKYGGKFIKGIFFTQAAGFLIDKIPEIQKIFNVAAYTMWSSYSWCDRADVYLACYNYPERERYHKEKFKKKENIVFVPLQDADFTNEYVLAPVAGTVKKYDILSVATPYQVKNLPMIAAAIRSYKAKYGKTLKTAMVLGSNLIEKHPDGTIDYSKLRKDHAGQLDLVKEILKDLYPSVEFFPFVKYSEMPKIYSMSKCIVLASLIEGKNRAITEAQSCNTPVVAFRQHNQWARGKHPIFYGNSGELAENFTPESLADAIHKVITNSDLYEPRKNFLLHSGRRNFVNILLDSIPYYRENIPEFKQGRIFDNVWVNLALWDNYATSYYDFLYRNKNSMTNRRGLESIKDVVDFYLNKMQIK